MSFIPKDENSNELTESEKSNPPEQKNEKKAGLSGVKSGVLLVVILVGLFYATPYLTGEKEFVAIPNLSLSGETDKAASRNELELPRVLNKEMKKLLVEFKEEYHKIVPADEVLKAQPSIRAAKFSKDHTKLLLELEYLVPAEEGDGASVSNSMDLIFTEDEFGRLVTTGKFKNIKLHPTEK